MVVRTVRTKAEYEELCDEIWHHNRCYFQNAAPEITDEEFDGLIALLERAEEGHPEWVSSTSPTQRVGERPLAGFAEVKHVLPMLSLEKAFVREELQAFYDRVCRLLDRDHAEFYGELKMDGLAISATYEKGELVRAVTRGDGRVGSDITQNFKTISHIPLRISRDIELLEVRGEVFLPKSAFRKMNDKREKEGLPLWANPRNAAAGSLKLLDSRELAKRHGLSCVFYGVAQQKPYSVHMQNKVISFLHSLGLPTYHAIKNLPEFRVVSSVEEMLEFQAEILESRERLPFEIDGVVFKLNSLDEANAIAPTIKHPRTAIAWKFGAEQVWTNLKEIVVQVGRTGVVTPVAELEPVFVSGSTVARATLHNADEIERKDIRPGDRVLIEKGGDVIPKVVKSDHTEKNREHPWRMPTVCPSCCAELIHEDVAFRCPNEQECPEQLIRTIVHFAGKDGLDIEHVGEQLVRALFEKGYIRTSSDLFKLTEDQLLILEGIKEKSAKNILQGIERAKHPDLSAFIKALGVRYIGAGAARKLAEEVNDVEGFLSLTKERILGIDGIGEEMAESLYATLQEVHFQESVRRLVQLGVQPTPPEKQAGIEGHPFNGATLVLTGTLESMPRSEAARRIAECGGKTGETVTKKTSYVVVGEKAGSKLEKAKKLNIPMLTEEEFVQFLYVNRE